MQSPTLLSPLSSLLSPLLHIHLCPLVGSRPPDALTLIARTAYAAAHDVVVRGIDDGLGVAHQLQFLQAFLFHRAEVLLMGVAKAGQHADGGLDDVVQSHHLAWLTDACLKDAYLGLLVQQPHGEGHANLRVVGTGRAGDLQVMTVGCRFLLFAQRPAPDT